MTKLVIPFYCLVCFTLLSVTSRAQELNPTVTVNIDQLSMDFRQEVLGMQAAVANYLTSVRYTRSDWEGELIPVDITIYVTGRAGNLYQARLAIVSKRLVNNELGTGAALLRTYDKEWTFNWNFNPVLSYQPMRYELFTSVLDFYMLIAIGLDMDTYEDQGGDRAFSDAKQIAQLGNAAGVSQFSSNFQPGEYTRMALITDLTDLRYVGLRRLIYDYHDATDLFGRDAEAGIKMLEQVISDLANYKRTAISNRSVLLQAFFDAKSLELAAIFKGRKNSPIWTDLRYLDAGNAQLYEQARGG